MPEHPRTSSRGHGRRLVDLLRDASVDSVVLSSLLVVLLLTIFGSARGEVELLRSGAGLPTLWTDTATTAELSRGDPASLDVVTTGSRNRASTVEGASRRSVVPPLVEEDDALMLSRETITLTSLGDTAAVTASFGNRSTARPRLFPGDEKPWVEGAPVLDRDALEEGRIVASAPGLTRLRVRAFGRGPATLTVRVRPEAPTAFALRPSSSVRPGDTLSILGYHMEEIDPTGVRVGGRPARIVERDSASVRVIAPSAGGSDACRGASRTVVTVESARTPRELSYIAARNGEVGLAVGESLRLPDGENCLRLSAEEGAEYVLAYFDRSPVDRPETRRSIEHANALYRNTSDPARVPPVTISVHDRSAGDGASADRGEGDVNGGEPRGDRRAGGRRDDGQRGSDEGSGRPFTITVDPDDRRECGADDFRDGCAEVFDRRRPWRPGDRFLITDPDDSRAPTTRGTTAVMEGHARVLLVRDRIAYAVYEPDESLFTPEWSDAFDRAVRALHREGIPYLRSILTRRHPVTSEGSGQLLVILAQLDGPVMGRSFTGLNSRGTNAEAHALIDLDNDPTFGTIYQVLAHEMAHAWNAQYRFEQEIPLGAHYHEEGLAEFLANDLMRRNAGISLTGDWAGWKTNDTATSAGQYGREARAQSGLLTEGYAGLAGLYRDLVARRMEAGESVREATRAVVRGGHENWSGLTRRMREVIPGWTPVEGILTWTLSQAADDRLASEVFRNTSFRSVSLEDASGWKPVGTLVAGEGGRSVRRDARYGSAGYFRLKDGIGGSFRITSRGTAERGSRGWGMPSKVAWMLLRVR